MEADRSPRKLGQPSGGSTVSPTSYAFLNHSTSTLPNNLPPSVDNKPLARQKRKRTSPEDQAVLEAAYLRDPKPDKTARLELVKVVALGEKEVQIWFQNRRQSSRRKSRPLLPHEVAQYQMSRSSGTSFGSFADSSELGVGDDSFDSSGIGLEDRGAEVTNGPHNEHTYVPSSQSPPRRSTALPAVDDAPTETHAPSRASPQPSSQMQLVPSSQPSSEQVALQPEYLANRRSAPSLRQSQGSLGDTPYLAAPHRRSEKSSSLVRLSMTSEGAAKIVTTNTSSPSPPKNSQASRMSFDNSQATPIPGPDFGRSEEETSRISLKRSASGRSRDSRAWEFWCDKDSRTELEEKAEKDGSGSAADAIGLMRANSGRRPLGSVPSKRNALLTRQPSSKRSKLDEKQPASQESNPSKTNTTSKGGLKPKGVSVIHIPGNDSDKENWSPEHDAYTASQPIVNTRDIFSTHQPEEDPDAVKSMTMHRKSSSVSQEEELDCVQGLLSLSQGNWR